VQSSLSVQGEELASLRSENEKLHAQISESQSAEAQLKEQIEQQRGELCESSEKLSSLYAQVKNDKEKIQLLQDQYAALQNQHAEVVDAHKLELEKLYKQLSEC
jgi:predicted nuclease with TOPRIM domain